MIKSLVDKELVIKGEYIKDNVRRIAYKANLANLKYIDQCKCLITNIAPNNHLKSYGGGVATVELNRGAGWETGRGITIPEGEADAPPMQFICKSGNAYKSYRGRIDNAAGFPVRLRFSGDYLYRVRGIAIYASAFAKDADRAEGEPAGTIQDALGMGW